MFKNEARLIECCLFFDGSDFFNTLSQEGKCISTVKRIVSGGGSADECANKGADVRMGFQTIDGIDHGKSLRFGTKFGE